MEWTRAQASPTHPFRGPLSLLPLELAYSGDATWNEIEPMDALISAWGADHPLRDEDGLRFPVGGIANEIHAGADKVGRNQDQTQEPPIQAAAFYPVARDVAVRLWLLDQLGDAAEARFGRPLPLSVQLCCHAQARLAMPTERPRPRTG